MTHDALEGVVIYAMQRLGIKQEKLTRFSIKNTQKGMCTSNGGITLPDWIFGKSDEYQIHYAIHETTHLKYPDHGNEFKAAETIINQDFGISIDYSKAYAKELRNSRGETVYVSWRENRKNKT